MIRPASAPVRCCGQAMLAQGCRPVPAASPRAFWRGEAAGTGWQPVAGMAARHRPRSARSAPRRGAGGLGGGFAPPVWSQAACNGRDRTRPPSPAARRGRSPRAPLAGDGRRPGAAVAGSAAPHLEQRGAEPGGERARTGRASLFAAVRRGRAIPPGEHRGQGSRCSRPDRRRGWQAARAERLVNAAAPSCVPVCGSRSGRRSPVPGGRAAGRCRSGRGRRGKTPCTISRACLRRPAGTAFTGAGGAIGGPLSIGSRP